MNCQSIKSPGKKAILQNMIEATQADIVIGTESWLDDSVRSAGSSQPTSMPTGKIGAEIPVEEEYSFWFQKDTRVTNQKS